MRGWVFILLSSALWASPMSMANPQQSLSPQPDAHVMYWMKTSRQHPHPVIRKNAVRVLGTLKEPEAVPILVEALKDEDPYVRLEAAQALGRQGDERAFTALREVADREADRAVRRAAKNSIELINAHLEYQKKNEKPEPGSQDE